MCHQVFKTTLWIFQEGPHLFRHPLASTTARICSPLVSGQCTPSTPLHQSYGPNELASPSALSAAHTVWLSAHGPTCQHSSGMFRLCAQTWSTTDNDAAWRNPRDLKKRNVFFSVCLQLTCWRERKLSSITKMCSGLWPRKDTEGLWREWPQRVAEGAPRCTVQRSMSKRYFAGAWNIL